MPHSPAGRGSDGRSFGRSYFDTVMLNAATDSELRDEFPLSGPREEAAEVLHVFSSFGRMDRVPLISGLFCAGDEECRVDVEDVRGLKVVHFRNPLRAHGVRHREFPKRVALRDRVIHAYSRRLPLRRLDHRLIRRRSPRMGRTSCEKDRKRHRHEDTHGGNDKRKSLNVVLERAPALDRAPTTTQGNSMGVARRGRRPPSSDTDAARRSPAPAEAQPRRDLQHSSYSSRRRFVNASESCFARRTHWLWTSPIQSEGDYGKTRGRRQRNGRRGKAASREGADKTSTLPGRRLLARLCRIVRLLLDRRIDRDGLEGHHQSQGRVGGLIQFFGLNEQIPRRVSDRFQ